MADTVEPSGYLHPGYCQSLAEFGRIRSLPASGSWLLERDIGATDHRDALAGYRHLFCSNWSALAADLDGVAGLVSVTAVTDPFAQAGRDELSRAFPDLVTDYKESYVVDLRQPAPSRHHRAKARKSTKALEVSVERDPLAYLSDWEGLYEDLRSRHQISGIKAFSASAFREQLATPGCVLVRAVAEGRSVAMTIWYVMGDVAYSHLTASSEAGYRSSASYAVIQGSIETFAGEGLRWLDLGAGAGLKEDPADGLSYFKRGWSSDTRQTYLCGRIYDQAAYAELVRDSGTAGTTFFPGYRAPGSGLT